MNSSGDLQWTGMHCSKDALTDVFGWFLQGLLAGMAFTCLIGKCGAIAVAYLVIWIKQIVCHARHHIYCLQLLLLLLCYQQQQRVTD